MNINLSLNRFYYFLVLSDKIKCLTTLLHSLLSFYNKIFSTIYFPKPSFSNFRGHDFQKQKDWNNIGFIYYLGQQIIIIQQKSYQAYIFLKFQDHHRYQKSQIPFSIFFHYFANAPQFFQYQLFESLLIFWLCGYEYVTIGEINSSHTSVVLFLKYTHCWYTISLFSTIQTFQDVKIRKSSIEMLMSTTSTKSYILITSYLNMKLTSQKSIILGVELQYMGKA